MTGSKRTATRVAVAGALPPPNWPRSGFNPDHDHKVSDEIRFVQLTPPGSACSIALGTGGGGHAARLAPGPAARGIGHTAARDELAGRGADVTDVAGLAAAQIDGAAEGSGPGNGRSGFGLGSGSGVGVGGSGSGMGSGSGVSIS
ncbi:MAG TPA: hypothetical protein VFB89_13250, partial [Gemmatimonadales bacterium]|nr:hypothetical protein [Gemmatimonadales bacterium]